MQGTCHTVSTVCSIKAGVFAKASAGGDVSKIHNFRNDMDDLAIHARPLDLAGKQTGPTPTRGRCLATSNFQAHLAGFAKDNEASSGSSRKKPRVHY
jgi:hypothetical protein